MDTITISTTVRRLVAGGLLAAGLALGAIAVPAGANGHFGGPDGLVSCQNPQLEGPVDNCDHPDDGGDDGGDDSGEEVIPEITPVDPPVIVQPTFTG